MVEQQPSKLMTAVRFRSPAPVLPAHQPTLVSRAQTREMEAQQPQVPVETLAKAPCIMHDIAAADLYMVRRIRFTEECSSMARAPVSKTGGWGFESLHSCQADRLQYCRLEY